MKKYVFRKYSSKYPKYFKQEKSRLVKFLGKSIKLEHVGSTAVPNLGGKGILDLSIGVGAKEIKKFRDKLIKLGYEFCPEAGTTTRLFFKRDVTYKNRIRRIHVHLTHIGTKSWWEFIKFRDHLLNHPQDVLNYIAIKKRAVLLAKGDGEKYRKFKAKFINQILQKIK